MLDLCRGCREDLPRNRRACRICADLLPAPGLCGHCQTHGSSLDQVVAPYLYQPPMDHLLTGLKFRGQLHHAPLLAELLIEELRHQVDPLPEALVPVPLHEQRIRQRGYNQALEIARPVARTLGIPLHWSLVRRRRATPPQSGLNEASRRRNVQDAFEYPHKEPIPFSHVAILDDVMTTGSTVEVLARLLKHHGVSTVSAWICARTPRH